MVESLLVRQLLQVSKKMNNKYNIYSKVREKPLYQQKSLPTILIIGSITKEIGLFQQNKLES